MQAVKVTIVVMRLAAVITLCIALATAIVKIVGVGVVVLAAMATVKTIFIRSASFAFRSASFFNSFLFCTHNWSRREPLGSDAGFLLLSGLAALVDDDRAFRRGLAVRFLYLRTRT